MRIQRLRGSRERARLATRAPVGSFATGLASGKSGRSQLYRKQKWTDSIRAAVARAFALALQSEYPTTTQHLDDLILAG
jgi:hypothetical protein